MDKEITDPYGFIYITTSMVNGKKYIGQKLFSCKGAAWKRYLGSGINLNRAVNKYGKHNFSREIVAIAFSKEELNTLEISFIESHNAARSLDYYNIACGGVGSTNTGRHWSEDTKRIMSAAHKGRILSEEHKRRISESGKGRHSTSGSHSSGKDHPMFGRKHSALTIAKMSDIKKGKHASDYTRSKMSESRNGESNPMYGLHRTDKMKQILSEANAKITSIQAKKICEKFSTGEYTQTLLAKEYSVSRRTIGNVVNHKYNYMKVS